MKRFTKHILMTVWCTALVLGLYSCNSPEKESRSIQDPPKTAAPVDRAEPLPFTYSIGIPQCDTSGCRGSYSGPEFIPEKYVDQLGLNGTDIAHQYSNKMCEYVGKQLKKLYREGTYSMADFNRIIMKTEGMGSGNNFVKVTIVIPFKRVPKEQATTAFDHSGGWGHTPEIRRRKHDLLNSKHKIVKNNSLNISPLLKTPEGLQEYWIQWQHSDYQ